ncbi:torsin-1A-like [Lingula anatina]|uniref:Torsin n=1 Tax=Lingula anatina TaxID=7574 RepID=A0A1S3KF34_LINAN|nr:torsin-1A-like [Lingula anatina]|eukprot:XP_013421097.1 torsin-1A-like [Lingula anatina]
MQANSNILVSVLFFHLTIFSLCPVETLEPVTSGIAVVTALAASGLFAGYELLKCRMYECCDDRWLIANLTGMKTALESRLHGQHLVVDTTVRAITGHIKNKNPQKALVLAFHGWTGGGKNFVSKIIAEHLYHKGMESQYVHLFIATLHFPHASKVETYKDQLRTWIKGNTTKCPRTLFIFDEMDKMPEGLIDAIKPFLDVYPEINGVNYRKTTFIFLSNTGGNAITEHTIAHWEKGKRREEIKHKDMENVIILSAYNEHGGLWHSNIIEMNLISSFVPFLPLERKHVKMCIRDDLRAKNISDEKITEEILSKVADELQYHPPSKQLFSKSGCKRVSQKVDLILEDFDND